MQDEGALPVLPPGRIVDLKGRGQTFVRDSGGGAAGAPPLLLLHGWGLTADFTSAALYDRLSRNRRVIALDVRGHGQATRSPAGFTLVDATDDVIAVLDDLGVANAVWCGYSMGGVISADAASRYPDRVAGAIITASAACYSTTLRGRVITGLIEALGLLPKIGIDGNPFLLIAPLILRRTEFFTAHKKWALDQLRSTSLTDIVKIANHLGRVDIRQQVQGATDSPMEMIITTRDELCPPHMQRDLASRIDAHVTEVVGFHAWPLSQPNSWLAVILDALHRIDGFTANAPSKSA